MIVSIILHYLSSKNHCLSIYTLPAHKTSTAIFHYSLNLLIRLISIILSAHKKMNPTDQPEPLFTILHFNDCYDIQPNKKDKFGIVNF